MALLAHQLRTPLSTINSLAQGMMRRAQRMSIEQIQTRAERIWRASLQLNELIDTIMSYTRLNTGAIALNPRPFNLKALIRRVCKEQGSYDPSRPIGIDVHALPGTFVGDMTLIEQALIIVLSNAMKYSPGSRPISITGHAGEGSVTIAVADQGMGIPEADMPFLMQPFFRGRNAQKLPGTGLGLSLALHILRLHGGNLEVKSREGHGTTVIITLPVGTAQA